MSARDFNHDVSAAKRRAVREPVVITDRGRPSHVLLSIDAYRDLVADPRTIVEWLSMEDDIDLVTEPLALELGPAQL